MELIKDLKEILKWANTGFDLYHAV